MKDLTKTACNVAEIYATLVGRVDSAITILEHMAEHQDFDWFHVAQVTEMLKAALLEAEELYIDGMEEEPGGQLIVLPPRD